MVLRPKFVNHVAPMDARLSKRPLPGYNATDMDPNQPQQTPHFNNPLEVMSPGERVICEMKRHPIGMLGIYAIAAIIILILGVGAALLPSHITNISDSARNLTYIVAIFGSIFVLLFVYIASIVYNGNRWVVTSDSITQIDQVSLFTKHTSQLSLANLEDVTFNQDGIIQTMFGYGTVKVETAGERSKFTFPFCPNPASCAREIIKAHEDFIQTHPEEGQTVFPGSFPQQSQPMYQQPAQPQYPQVSTPAPQDNAQQFPQNDDNQANDPTRQA